MARAEYDFTAASEEEISVRSGDMLNLAPKGETAGHKFILSCFSHTKIVLTHMGIVGHYGQCCHQHCHYHNIKLHIHNQRGFYAFHQNCIY